MTDSPEKRKSIGRPRKFAGASRVVTLTLPERTLDKLAAIDADRAKAIVAAAELAAPLGATPVQRVELKEVGSGMALLTVPYCEPLQRIPELTLIQIAPNRHLIILLSGTPLSHIELSILDQLAQITEDRVRDRDILQQLVDQLRNFRRSRRLNTAELIVFKV